MQLLAQEELAGTDGKELGRVGVVLHYDAGGVTVWCDVVGSRATDTFTESFNLKYKLYVAFIRNKHSSVHCILQHLAKPPKAALSIFKMNLFEKAV